MKKKPNKNCPWCSGYGYEWIDCGDIALSGYDYRRLCRCLEIKMRKGKLKGRLNEEKKNSA